jgi:hypothetical protein
MSTNKQSGISILGILLLGVIIILVLSYFNISIKAVVNSPTGQENVSYVKGTTQSVWDKYLAQPAHYLWQDVWVKIFWQPFISNMERLNTGQPTDIDKAAPRIN